MLLLRPVSNSSPYMSVFPRGFPLQAARSCGTKLRSQSFQRKSACFHVYTLLYNLRQYWFAKKSLLLQDPKTQCFLPKNCETQPPVSIGWVALSSVVGHSVVPHRWHLLQSPLYDVSNHTNHIFSVRIWSWQRVSVNISSVAELSPVYCFLVEIIFHILWSKILLALVLLTTSVSSSYFLKV